MEGLRLALALLLVGTAWGCQTTDINAASSGAAPTIPASATMVDSASIGKPPTEKKKLKTIAEDESLQDVEHHALVQKKVGFYAVFLPHEYSKSTKHYPLVVILHGSGSNEVRHGSLANDFGREQAIYVAPRAPHPHHEVFAEFGTPGWTAWPTYPEKWGKWDSPGFPKDRVKDVDAGRLYVEWIASVIEDVRRQYRVTNAKAVLYGHSQGAAFAHQFAVQRPELVRAYFAFAGYYGDTTDNPELDAPAIALKKHGVHIMLAHHELDDVVKVEQTRLLSGYLKRHGVEHVANLLPAGSHLGGPEVKRLAAEFIRSECQRDRDPDVVEK